MRKVCETVLGRQLSSRGCCCMELCDGMTYFYYWSCQTESDESFFNTLICLIHLKCNGNTTIDQDDCPFKCYISFSVPFFC
jgi:hypothetical protein